jgi:hypothetical protein
MEIFDNFKKALDRCTNPNKNTDKMDVMDAIKYYYKVMILPMIASIAIALIVGSVATLSPISTGAFGIVSAVFAAVSFLILFPIGMLLSAAVIQLFSKMVFGIFKGNYSKTFTAMMFGTLPVVLFYWLTYIPILGMLILLFAIWSIYVTTVSLSKQQNVSIGKAFLGWLIPTVILAVIELVLMFVMFASLGLAGLMHL